MNHNFFATILFSEDETKRFFRNEKFTKVELILNTEFYSFETKEELDAFLLGLEAGIGWHDFVCLKNLKLDFTTEFQLAFREKQLAITSPK
jgi:hypothetical protein